MNGRCDGAVAFRFHFTDEGERLRRDPEDGDFIATRVAGEEPVAIAAQDQGILIA